MTHDTVDWATYSKTYDLLLQHNPAYRDLIDRYHQYALENIQPDMHIIDVGAGTGNFSEVLLNLNPKQHVTLVEPDPGMMARSKEKLSTYPNCSFKQAFLQDVKDVQDCHAVVWGHSLYTMPEPHWRLREVRGFCKKGAKMFIIDYGRKMDVVDWRRYLLKEIVKELGIVAALKLLWKGREIAHQNNRVASEQEAGNYWLHDSAEFAEALEQNGWKVLKQDKVYRGCSDLAICEAV